MKKLISTGLVVCGLLSPALSQTVTWVNCTATLTAGKSFPAGITGCSGVRANRLTGEVYMNCIQNGIWKSSNKGQNWTRIDQNTVGGRNETGWGMDQDQEHPDRLANFSLDGTAAWTADGVTWKAMTGVGRNWDYGSVDWGSTNPRTIFACTHEAGGYLDVSTDGGTTWRQLAARINSGSALATISMVGVMDSTTLIYHTDNNGIQRSTDLGNTWTQVSTRNPQSRVPVLFKGTHYLCTNQGLLVSKDKGATWQSQGASVNIFQGPFFGENESTMVVVGNLGIFHTVDAGTQWTKIGNICPSLGPDQANYWATYTWDPINNCCYATRMTNDGYRADIPAATRSVMALSGRQDIEIPVIGNSVIYWSRPFNSYSVIALNGSLLYQWRGNPVFSAALPNLTEHSGSPLLLKITSADGGIHRSTMIRCE